MSIIHVAKPSAETEVKNKRKELRSQMKGKSFVYYTSPAKHAFIYDYSARNAAMLEHRAGYGYLLQRRNDDHTYDYIFVRSSKPDDKKFQ